jgi:hypothetical protein
MFSTYLKITARFYYACYRKGPEEEIGTGIDLFLDWENDIWFSGTPVPENTKNTGIQQRESNNGKTRNVKRT